MSRCFTQNDTLFRIKRHVVLHKTTRCFLRKREWNRVEVTEKSKRMLCLGASGCILVVYGECVTLVTAKSAKSLLRVRARERDWWFSQLIIYGYGRLGFIQYQKEMLQKQVLQHLLLC